MYKIILFLFIPFISIYLEEINLEFPASTKLRREEYKLEMQNTIYSEILAYSKKMDERLVKKSFEYMQILNYLEEDGYQFLKMILTEYPTKSENFYSAALEASYTLYETGFEEEMENILSLTTNLKHFAIVSNFILRKNPNEKGNHLKLLQTKFKNSEKNPMVKILSQYLNSPPVEHLSKRPPIKDLFSHNFGEGRFILFSLQRLNRDYPGLLIIKNSDGKFIRREDGSIFSISQLARSISDLPSYVVNGNTPQGIFSIQKIKTVKSDVIGPTPAVITALPFEVSPDIFFHTSTKSKKWKIESYLNLFPVSWRFYFPIQQAFIAGEIGRSGIYAHGTTVDTEFYADYSYYPNTPTRGCLSAKEIWSKKTGKSIYSDQVSLLKVLKNFDPTKGYMIVIELDDQQNPVSLDEVLMDILEVEEAL